MIVKFLNSTCILLSIILIISCSEEQENISTQEIDNSLKPWTSNPKYWQYLGQPVLLLGATDNDNLFQSPDMVEQLDLLVKNGGNYIRNTMSSRDSLDEWPFKMLVNGKYDLDDWNTEYWNRVDNLLNAADKRNVIVQIEVWDRFDYSRDPWKLNPFNPENNINYDSLVGMSSTYPIHPAADVQPFFHTPVGLPLYSPSLDEVMRYQEKYIDKLLQFTLQYRNVLYCMNNETSTPKEWGLYWMKYISNSAKEEDKDVYVTDMFDHYFTPRSCDICNYEIENPGLYQFVDVSQINSRNFGQMHWDSLKWIVESRNRVAPLRPVNCVKTYGGMNSGWGSGSNQDGIERLVRQMLLGVAAGRHHRSPHGNGNNEKALASLRSIRKIEESVKFWELEPAMEILNERIDNEAYAARNGDEHYVVYFPSDGSVIVNLPNEVDQYQFSWIDIRSGKDQEIELDENSKHVVLTSLSDTGGFYILSRKK